MDVRVEGALGLDLGETVPLEQRRERAMDELDALLELRLLVGGRRLERPLEVVEHGQELVQEPLVRARGDLDVLARDPLAVVVEVGREAEIRLVVEPRSRGGFLRRRLLARLDELVLARRPLRRSDAPARSRGLGLFLVDDLVVGVLDHLVGVGRGAPFPSPAADACCSADACE